LITWAIAITVFHQTKRIGVFALGYGDLSGALLNGMALKLAALLLVGKLIATIAGYGFGGCGGIFSPNLFFGGMAGAITADLGKHFLALNQFDSALLTVGAMSACLGAVVQAPVTAILIIFEMTHQFALVPGLMLAGLVSQVIARSLQKENFYDQILVQDGHQIEHLIPPRDLRSWQNLPISAIANFQPVVIEDLSRERLQKILDDHPYRFFPVVEDEKIRGVAARSELERAMKENRTPELSPAIAGQPRQTIREAQALLIESTSGTIVLTDRPNGKIIAVVTLHDLLRAQLAMSEREGK
jgi:CIC family chloride channel protein